MNEDTPLPFVTDIPDGLLTSVYYAVAFSYDGVNSGIGMSEGVNWAVDHRLVEPPIYLPDGRTEPLKVTERGEKFLEELNVHIALLYSTLG